MFNKTLLWDITSECNLRCKHCYNYDKYFNDNEKKYTSLNIYDLKKIIEIIKVGNFDHIHLLGGEPLLKNEIYEVIEYATNLCIDVTINTNGTLLNKENSIKLLKSGISQISVSLDSPIEYSNDAIRGLGTFRTVTNNLNFLSSLIKEYNSDIKLQVVSVITKGNLNEINYFPSLLRRIGVDYLNVLSLYNCGNATNNKDDLMYGFDMELKCIKELLETTTEVYPDLKIQLDVKPAAAKYLNRIMTKNKIKINESRCLAGDKIWLMEPNGDIYPCSSCNLATSDHLKKSNLLPNKSVNILNLQEFKSIYNTNIYRDFNKLKETNIKNKKCLSCEFINICDGGCPLQENFSIDCCDFVLSKQQEYSNQLEVKQFRISEHILHKYKDDSYTFFNIRTNTLDKYHGWKANIINKICIENNIKLADFEELNNKNKVKEFILDLLSLGYIEEIII